MELGLSLGDAPKQNNKRGFCMALGINSHKLIHHQTETDLHINILPIRISSLPCSSHNGSSENGSSGNMGPAAAAKRAAEASSANSVGSMELGMYLRNVNQNENDVVEGERASSRASDDDENGLNNRKKLRLSKHQSASLEQSFKQNNTLNPKEKVALAKQLNLRARQVEVWFQNRRARTKLKQTEVDCEYLKRFCETLTEENRRLHKELAELRVLKTCPNNPFHVATTLTMCPSCQRVATAAAPPPPETTTRPRFVPFSQQIRPNQPTPTNQSFTNIATIY